MSLENDKQNLVARASVTIDASISEVWEALINPSIIRQYMFGTNVVSDWKEGSDIVWKGQWQGKTYEDKGVILALKPRHMISYSHFSPLSGMPDIPENYHHVNITLIEKGRQTIVSLEQDKNTTPQTREHSENNWKMMLESLKKLLETS